jgi:hypothetical protein
MGWFYDCKDTKGDSGYASLMYSETNEAISTHVLIMKGTSSSKSLSGFCPVSTGLLSWSIPSTKQLLAPYRSSGQIRFSRGAYKDLSCHKLYF